MIIKRWLASLLCCCLALTSCSTLRDVPLPGGATAVSGAGIKVGDNVIVTLHDGTSHKLKVVLLDTVALTGKASHSAETERYTFADMQILEVQRFSFWKTSGVAAAALVVVVAALFAAMLSGLDDED